MGLLAFPCWTLRTDECAACVIDNSIMVFSSVERATSFLNSRLNGRGELKLVSRQSMRQLAVDLRGQGVDGIRLDPQPDGSGGGQSPLSELSPEFS